ncbi:DUF4381 domain-containing protein [Pseudomonas schmalbachii]|uniref:DUF4381 domain-containing protein n=1 Tax=Pseudomonas schmalbachii TaxID=2816993 RepID=A0ABS3TJK4_9PSED|nr:DUF4381 domain-containing protein [Pseudomonas schmalbachii]MBO3273842.1 DUF4381 domain-containing protein [Pseudomonas schmalbachii]
MSARPDISQLQELPLPPPVVSYVPQTWGWLVLALLLLVLLAAWLVMRRLRWQRERYRREALRRLDQLAQDLGDPERRLRALRELPELLKRVALSTPQAPAVERLGGAEWQAFLQRHGGAPLPADFARQLALLAYAPGERVLALADSEVQALLGTTRKWIEAHHVAA